ncbi:MAG: C40 family peptidase [Candidatus Fermentibacteraceae bacterium]
MPSCTFVIASLLTVMTAADSLPPVDLACAIVSEAISHVGTPYVWGGTDSSGFDCSGLVYRVFGDNGVPLPRTAGAMASAGTEVSRDSLLPGDLLIFQNPGHVGIYIGDGNFIHSSSYRNIGVTVTPVDQSNYVRRFVSAVRVLR